MKDNEDFQRNDETKQKIEQVFFFFLVGGGICHADVNSLYAVLKREQKGEKITFHNWHADQRRAMTAGQ